MAKLLANGDPAPDLAFTTHDGRRVSLSDFRGKQAVVVYFYPRDNTPICTTEACAFRDAYDDFVREGSVVIGVSSDSDASHRTFAGSHHLPYLLVADVDGSVRQAFGVPKTMGIFPGRVTYVIDRDGFVRHVFNSQWQGEMHVEESLRIVRELSRTDPG